MPPRVKRRPTVTAVGEDEVSRLRRRVGLLEDENARLAKYNEQLKRQHNQVRAELVRVGAIVAAGEETSGHKNGAPA